MLLPDNEAYGFSSENNSLNCSIVKDCGPSDNAHEGLLCTSISKPSHPHATAALDSGPI